MTDTDINFHSEKLLNNIHELLTGYFSANNFEDKPSHEIFWCVAINLAINLVIQMESKLRPGAPSDLRDIAGTYCDRIKETVESILADRQVKEQK